MWSASALLGLRCPLLLYWSLIPHAGQCVMPMACALASTCFLNCLCSLVLVLLTAFSLLCVLFVLGGGASQRQRDERLRRLTLLSVLFFFSFFFSCLWNGVCCVVRAQPCEHARSTTRALCVLGLSTACGVCYFYHNAVFVVPTTHCSLLTVATLTIEHCAPLITL